MYKLSVAFWLCLFPAGCYRPYETQREWYKTQRTTCYLKISPRSSRTPRLTLTLWVSQVPDCWVLVSVWMVCKSISASSDQNHTIISWRSRKRNVVEIWLRNCSLTVSRTLILCYFVEHHPSWEEECLYVRSPPNQWHGCRTNEDQSGPLPTQQCKLALPCQFFCEDSKKKTRDGQPPLLNKLILWMFCELRKNLFFFPFFRMKKENHTMLCRIKPW